MYSEPNFADLFDSRTPRQRGFLYKAGLQVEYDLQIAAQTMGRDIEKRVHPHAV
jgi:hypothetical protein